MLMKKVREVNIGLKKKIIHYSMIIVILLVISSLFVKNQDKAEKKPVSVAVISMNKAGSINLEENEFFKKYTINCLDDVKDIIYSDNKSDLTLTLKKSDVANFNINSNGQVDLSQVKAKVNNEDVMINFKKLYEKENYIHVDKSNKKNVIVFISKKEQPYKYKVVVNPGHGGIDKGASYGKIYEKDLTLKISLLMEDHLRFNGCEPIYTRKVDDGLDFKKATTFANDQKADLFISVHINSGDRKEYNGIGTYYNYPNDFQKNERTKLAQSVESEVLKNDQWKNMGTVRRTDLYVLNRTLMPSALVECGYILNDGDREKLLKDQVLNNLATNISNGIVKYLFQK